jgi:2-polyprenyl-6-methoxyphenol hydroxylase-like FAD-dependent oxidoreductase
MTVDVDVVVIGAGPTGLMVAGELRLAGVEVVVLERLPAPTGLSKALGLYGRAVQALDYRGLLDRFDTGSLPASVFARMAHLGGIPLQAGRLVETAPPGYFPAVVPARQAQVEQVLEAWAKELGADIRRGHQLVELSQDQEAVTAQVCGPEGDYRLRAGWLVGCDGAHSLVRRQAGIGFPGTPPTLVSCFGDVSLPAPAQAQAARLGMRRTAAGTVTAVPLGGDLWRVVVSEPVGQRHRDGDTPPTLEELHAGVRRVLGTDLEMGQAYWLSRFTDAARLAAVYRAGRVLVAGDAAHIQLPAGGPGMTTGLQDAVNLGWKLAATVRGWAPPGLLDTYHAERHPVAARMQSFVRAQSVLLAPGEQVSALRELVGELLTHERPLRDVIDRLLGLDIRYDYDPGTTPAHPLAGGWAPDLPLLTDHGHTRLATLMRPARPVLLDLTPDGRLQAAATGWADRVQTTMARSDGPLDQPLEGMLVRPDGYVAWAAAAGEADSGLRRALATWFGPV